MARTGATCDYLNARRRLFLEMLAVTEDLERRPDHREVTSDNLSIIDSLIDAREALMREIDSLDERHRTNGSVASPPDLARWMLPEQVSRKMALTRRLLTSSVLLMPWLRSSSRLTRDSRDTRPGQRTGQRSPPAQKQPFWLLQRRSRQQTALRGCAEVGAYRTTIWKAVNLEWR